MKQHEIKHCSGCGRGIGHANSPTFYTAKLGHHIVDFSTVRQQSGLEMMIGAPLAAVMGPDPEISHELSNSGEIWICLDCAMQRPLAELLELSEERKEEAG